MVKTLLCGEEGGRGEGREGGGREEMKGKLVGYLASHYYLFSLYLSAS